MDIKVSFIVPAYNVSRYISKCVWSILNQSLKEIEIIVVNDGSTDDTLEILNSFTDKRLKIISHNNQGASAARNNGLGIAIGKYIIYVDGDDFVCENDVIDKIYRSCVKDDLDIAILDFYKYTNNQEIYVNDGIKMGGGDIDKNMLISGIVDTKISHNIWNKLFKRELFDDVKFPNGVFLSEDLHTFVRLIFKAKKIAKFNTAFYKYRIGDNNTSGFESLKGMKDHKFVYEDLISFINKNDINNKEKLIQKLSYRKIRSTYLPLVFCKKDLSNANFVKALEILKSDLTEILSSSGFKKLGFKYQILFYILKFAKKNEQICTIFEYFSKLNGVFKKRKEKIFKD